ncbi:riboflavin synthase alpha chain [Tahibacter aquaticus]|uniref:Riboflavin synthase n=1 Tax=Tahibacter aquaticus TaxID=520092 RepID=A0A4R6ZAH1_9GAMM|nr:riboflavin synthase [Tahibacter aquaticus]TDR48754.1 riboflavin synthase alpha chain [Tahibacter aquaticus]
MFTGIIQAVGRIAALEPVGGDLRISIDASGLDLADVRLGDSIAVDGVCLTAIALDGTQFAADVSVETLNCTTLGQLKPGSRVNLEKALRLADRLGGHLVSGHVDGVGEVVSVLPEARSLRWTFAVPAALARYIAAKGSVAINGVSLTVNAVDGRRFGVNLIPHTMQNTTFGDCAAGTPVNIEVDLMARYAERLGSLIDDSDE